MGRKLSNTVNIIENVIPVDVVGQPDYLPLMSAMLLKTTG
jgi:hypothetical protein